ncbi:MAG: Mg-chelatase subunit ChlD [Acidobacteria bacterium OLB17]|nr:MAG: Mg-chelatase subunit ChlD [Acidobacteria bacterium OLB17]MCZ2391099.1 VWA domain-containing protein [Acidobacteriota bacterium]
MKKLLGRLSFTISILLMAFAASGQAQTPTPTPAAADDGEVIKVESRLIVVPAAVTDAAGEPVLGLNKESFSIQEAGKPQIIEAVSSADQVPLEIALLFDVSATTSPMYKFQQETAAKFLAQVMRPEDRAAVFSIGDTPVLIHGRDTAQASAAAIRSIQPTKQYTAFYDTVAAAVDYLKKNAPETSRRVIVVISDGEDTNSERIAKAISELYRTIGKKIDKIDSKTLRKMTADSRDNAAKKERARVLKKLQDADTVFYSINPAGSSYELNTISIFGQENMANFAEDTGGTAFLPKFQPVDTDNALANDLNMKRNAKVLDRIFTQLTNELRSQYLIQFYSEGEFPLGSYVKLAVKLTAPAGRTLRARQGYYVK